MAKNLSFSYSKMSLYRECPQKFKFRYIHKIPESPKYYFAFGNAMHKALEYLYNVQQPPSRRCRTYLTFLIQTGAAQAMRKKATQAFPKNLKAMTKAAVFLFPITKNIKILYRCRFPLNLEPL
ncbi:ATP-dependent helicase/DNAse subunit B [Elusimicrobium posterum]|uniref:PD-(D/E)XK nuclease family protein n=1 Tax=Elusimicrobium posterum TaxID=3116653 RepID=UPI003C727B89